MHSNFKKILATREKVISMYSTSKVNQQRNAIKYYEAMKLRERLGFGSLRISRAINMPMAAVHYWLQGFEPKSVKGVKELENMGLLPLRISNLKSFVQFVRAFGLRLADGCIYEQKRNNSYTGYVCFSNIKDAIKFVDDCKEAWKVNLTPHFSSNAYYVYLPASLVRLMIVVGSPVGDKTLQIFNLPKWIYELPPKLKFVFLDGLFSGDGEIPRLKSSGLALESLKISLSSEKSVVDKFSKNFMLDLWRLISSVGIKASKPKIMYNQPRIAKDGRVTYPIHIRILTERKNMIKFLNNIEYRYNIKGNKTVKGTLEALRKNDMLRC